jgi:hypothetical protein
MTPTARDVIRLVKQIEPLLAGQPRQLQGAVLADLLAIWLAGHYVEGDQAATTELRAELLKHHLETVDRLVPVNEKMMGLNE